MQNFQTNRGRKKETSINPEGGSDGGIESSKQMAEMDMFYVQENTQRVFIVITQI